MGSGGSGVMCGGLERFVMGSGERTRKDRASENHGEGVLIMTPIQKERRASGSHGFLVTGGTQAEPL